MFIDQIAADDTVGTLPGKSGFCVHQFCTRRRRHRAINVVDPAVRAKAKRIEIAGTRKMLLCTGVISQHPQAAGNSEFQFGVVVINLGRSLIGLQRFGKRAGALQFGSLLHQRIPGTQIVLP